MSRDRLLVTDRCCAVARSGSLVVICDADVTDCVHGWLNGLDCSSSLRGRPHQPFLSHLQAVRSQVISAVHLPSRPTQGVHILLITTSKPASKHESTERGWEDFSGMLVLSKYPNPLPKSLLTICSCSVDYKNRRCGCRPGNVNCSTFCHDRLETFDIKGAPVMVLLVTNSKAICKMSRKILI